MSTVSWRRQERHSLQAFREFRKYRELREFIEDWEEKVEKEGGLGQDGREAKGGKEDWGGGTLRNRRLGRKGQGGRWGRGFKATGSPAAFRQRRHAAFTFLEIMFVVMIIGVLSGIAGHQIIGKKKIADINACRAQIDIFGTALVEYELHLGRHPDTSEGLKALVERPAEADEGKWVGPYIKNGGVIPKDPWGGEYRYKSPGERDKDYDLWSPGPDKQDNTDDDIANWKPKR